MPIPSRTDLKALFETGDTPTQADFATLIDAFYDLAQETQTAAAAAQADVDAFLAANAGIAALCHVTVGASMSLLAGFNVASVTSLAGPTSSRRKVRVTFTTALASADYSIQAQVLNGYANALDTFVENEGIHVMSKTTTKIEFWARDGWKLNLLCCLP